MPAEHDEKSYALLTPVGPDGESFPHGLTASRWRVATAQPKEGSLTERVLSNAQEHDTEEAAAAAFFALMRTGLPGVLDAANLRLHEDTPLAFAEAMTDHVLEACEAAGGDTARADDWDNTEFSALRDAMVDACPEYSGEDPDSGPQMG